MKKKWSFAAVFLAAVVCVTACASSGDQTGDAAQNADIDTGTASAGNDVSVENVVTPKSGSAIKDDGRTTGETSQFVDAGGAADGYDTVRPVPEHEDTVSVETRLQDDLYMEYLAGERDAVWRSTYLVWIPEFTDGAFTGTGSGEEFDYAYFAVVGGTGVVRSYLERLADSGYTNVTGSDDADGMISFAATNADGWRVTVEYDEPGDCLRIGSGQAMKIKNRADETDELWSHSVLMYIPVFTAGELSTHSDDGIGGSSATALFRNVSSEEVKSYIALLKQSGYTDDAEEGDEDGIVWYIAYSGDELFCDVRYSDGMCRVVCGQY